METAVSLLFPQIRFSLTWAVGLLPPFRNKLSNSLLTEQLKFSWNLKVMECCLVKRKILGSSRVSHTLACSTATHRTTAAQWKGPLEPNSLQLWKLPSPRRNQAPYLITEHPCRIWSDIPSFPSVFLSFLLVGQLTVRKPYWPVLTMRARVASNQKQSLCLSFPKKPDCLCDQSLFHLQMKVTAKLPFPHTEINLFKSSKASSSFDFTCEQRKISFQQRLTVPVNILGLLKF